MAEVSSRNKAYFESKYNTVVEQVSSVVTAFLQRLDDDANDNVCAVSVPACWEPGSESCLYNWRLTLLGAWLRVLPLQLETDLGSNVDGNHAPGVGIRAAAPAGRGRPAAQPAEVSELRVL